MFEIPQSGTDLYAAWDKTTDDYMTWWYLINDTHINATPQQKREYERKMKAASQSAKILEGILHQPIIKSSYPKNGNDTINK